MIFSAVGAAEPLIHALKLAGVAHTLQKVDHDEFKKLNGRGAILEISGRKFYSVPAAMRYAGKLDNNWGWNADPFKAIVMDEYFEECLAVKTLINQAAYLTEPGAMVDRRNQISEEQLPELLEKIEKQVAKVGTGYLFADGPGVIDCEITAFVTWLTKGTLAGIPKNVLDDFNNVVRVHYQIMRHPRIGRNVMKGASDH